jgi:hypothetical protein
MRWNYLILAASVVAITAASQASAAVGISVLSSMPQLVTGEDALVRITGATAAPTVTVGTKDVSAAFSKDANGNYVGLVTGLAVGNNTLTAKAGTETATLTLVDRAINDTLFAGPQQTPFICKNETFKLAPAKDATCAAPTVVDYQYRDKTGMMKPFDPKGARPADIATVKINGKDVPVIVRFETGVINRSAYQIQMIHDPATPLPTPTSNTNPGYNGKLVFTFGAGVGAGYHMGNNYGGFSAQLLDLGYAEAAASLSVFGNQPSDVLSAETFAKVKEKFVEQFGQPIYTLGQGGSGGSMQQNMIANAYPGLLDAIMPERLYSDTMTFLRPLYDCELMVNMFKQGTWTREQMNAVSGKYWGYCVSNGTRYPRARTDGCDAGVLAAVDKDPALKAKPPRCTFQDNLVNVFGADPKTGFANNPFDNVGVQYGLKALNDGVITMAQFIDINTRIGGHDVDGKIVAQRQVGSEAAIKASYMTGRINEMTGGIKDVIYVDWRTYADGDPNGRGDPNVDVHDRYHSDIAKARIQKYTGTLNNYVRYLTATGALANSPAIQSPAVMARNDAYDTIDKWMMAVLADTSNKSKAEKIAASRPKGLVDTCYAQGGGADLSAVSKITDWAKCDQLFPFYSDSRIAAGGPLVDDIFKCQLKPIDVKDYKVAPTADQMAALQKVFATGVCDYTKPGVGQEAKLTTWAVFKGDGTWVGL